MIYGFCIEPGDRVQKSDGSVHGNSDRLGWVEAVSLNSLETVVNVSAKSLAMRCHA